MVGWHHRLNGHEFKQALGVADRQGSLTCCSPWGQRVGHILINFSGRRFGFLKKEELSQQTKT